MSSSHCLLRFQLTPDSNSSKINLQWEFLAFTLILTTTKFTVMKKCSALFEVVLIFRMQRMGLASSGF